MIREFCRSQRMLAEAMGQNVRSDWYGWHDMIAELGCDYEGRPLPRQYPVGEPSWCFANAYELAKAFPGLRYVEGAAISKDALPIPVGHAWCIDQDGLVVDPTWHGSDGAPEGRAYLGIVIPLEHVAAARVRNKGDWSVLDSDWRGNNWFIAGGWREVLNPESECV